MKLAATTGAVASGALALNAGSILAAQDDRTASQRQEPTVIEPSEDEKKAFQVWKQRYEQVHPGEPLAIPIPYAYTIGAVSIVGVLYLRDPVENSSTTGVVAGAVNGTYTLDKNTTEARFYDPTGALLRLDLKIHFRERFFETRLCTRVFTGWSCSRWERILSW